MRGGSAPLRGAAATTNPCASPTSSRSLAPAALSGSVAATLKRRRRTRPAVTGLVESQLSLAVSRGTEKATAGRGRSVVVVVVVEVVVVRGNGGAPAAAFPTATSAAGSARLHRTDSFPGEDAERASGEEEEEEEQEEEEGGRASPPLLLCGRRCLPLPLPRLRRRQERRLPFRAADDPGRRAQQLQPLSQLDELQRLDHEGAGGLAAKNVGEDAGLSRREQRRSRRRSCCSCRSRRRRCCRCCRRPARRSDVPRGVQRRDAGL